MDIRVGHASIQRKLVTLVENDDTKQEDTSDLPRDREPVIRITPMPKDTNPGGDIFGGWIMSHVDLAGGVIATRRANGRVATVAVNSFSFKKPVLVGDLVSIYGHVIRVGDTSITVALQVFAERRWLTYVAIDENRRPRPIAPDLA
jgi:acyl-CoA thioesterase YciA